MRLRRRASALWLGHLVLAATCAALSWATLRTLDTWLLYSIYAAAAVLLVLLWLIPAWRYAVNFTDITTTRILSHGGIFGRVKRDIQVSAITSIEFVSGQGVVISVGNSEPLIVSRTPRPKALAEQLRKSLAI